jgi:cysteine desulfurase
MDNIIYLDNNATTPVDSRVLEAMLPYFSNEYANASSTHNFGQSIKKSINRSREEVANLIGANSNEIIFTSGATESINLSLIGYALANIEKGKHIITLKTEHKAVLDTCKYLETIGFEISYLSVNNDGLIDLNKLKSEINDSSILISVMFVNNEIGVIQPIKEIANIAHDSAMAFFCDATQAVGKVDILVNEFDIDIMAFSGHKFYAPKGIGGLYIKGLSNNKFKLQPILHGGGHENGIRSGTLNVPGIVALGKACELAKKEMNDNAEIISALRNELENDLLKFPGSFVNGSIENRIYNVCNICFPGMDANVMIGKMKNVAVSNGSACTSAIIEPSHVLAAIGLSDRDAFASIRFSLGKYNNRSEVHTVSKLVRELFIKS